MIKKRLAAMAPKGSFARSVSMLAGGTAFAQALMVLSLPILTRIYTPEDFNLLAVYMSVIGMITVVSCLRYNIAIPIPEDELEGISLLGLAICSTIIISAIITIPVLLKPNETSQLLGQPALSPYLWMIPLGVFLASSYSALEYWATRKKNFGLVTKTRMARAAGGTGTQLTVGAIHPSPFGLIFGHMIYGGMGVVKLIRSIWINDRELLKSVRFINLVKSSTYYKRYPLLSVPEALFNTAGSQVPVLIIAAYALGPEAGFLMLAMRVMAVPVGLVGTSVAQVYISTAPEMFRNNCLADFTKSTMISLLKVGGAPLLVMGALSPFLFGWIFGEEWRRAGQIVAWLTPWFIVQFVVSPVSVVLHVTGNVIYAMWLQFGGLIVRTGSVVAAVMYFEQRLVEVYAISGAVFYCLYLAVVMRLLRKIENSKGNLCEK